MGYFVYILFSQTKDRYYIGSTSDMEARLLRHNQNSKGFTGKVADWEVKYKEVYACRTEGLKRELQIKKWKSRKMIEKLISDGEAV